MEESTSKEKLLKSVRNALIMRESISQTGLDLESSVYQPIHESLDVAFAQEFTRIGGKFVYCEDEEELFSTLQYMVRSNNLFPVFCANQELMPYFQKYEIPVTNEEYKLNRSKATITLCEFLIARLGSIMISSRMSSGRSLPIIPDVHIVIARSSQLVPDLEQALQRIREKYGNKLPSFISVISGPSRTADIEKTLVMGAHGPKELILFLLDDLHGS